MQEELPPGWGVQQSRSWPDSYYYVELATGHTQWHPPPGTKTGRVQEADAARAGEAATGKEQQAKGGSGDYAAEAARAKRKLLGEDCLADAEGPRAKAAKCDAEAEAGRVRQPAFPSSGPAHPRDATGCATATPGTVPAPGQLLLPLPADPEGARPGGRARAGHAGPGGLAQPERRCDKCDGPHASDDCPHFTKPREDHRDSRLFDGDKMLRQLGADGAGCIIVKNARLVQQPADGSCLFHSLCHGLGPAQNASSLRREIAIYIASNPQAKISGDTLEEWVRWDASMCCDSYARQMAREGWGGGIEMAVFSLLKNVSVHVYERRGSAFQRITCFDRPEPSKIVHVVYQGRKHYDALVVRRC